MIHSGGLVRKTDPGGGLGLWLVRVIFTWAILNVTDRSHKRIGAIFSQRCGKEIKLA